MGFEPNAPERLRLLLDSTSDTLLRIELQQVLESSTMNFAPGTALRNAIAGCDACRSDGIRRRLVKAFKQFSLRGRYLAVIINTFNEAFRGRACCLLLDVQPIVQCCVVNSADDQAKKIRLTIGVSARACTVLLPSILDEFFIKTCRCEVPVAFYRHRASYSDISALHYQEKVIKSVSRFARLEMQLCDRTEFGLKRKFSAEDLREKPSGNLIGKCKATTTGGLCGCSFFSHCLSALILRYLSTKPG